MRVSKTIILAGVLGMVMAAGPALSQTPPPPTPAPQTPPAQQTPAAPAADPQPPRPFPEGARIAWVDLQLIVATSAEGKAGTARLQEFEKKRMGELQDMSKKLEDMRSKLIQGGTVMSDQARTQLEKDIEKLNRELQFAQQDAQSDRDEMQNELQQEFLRKLSPILNQIAQEKGLHMIFEIRNTAAIFAEPGLDLSQEVIRRFDEASKSGATKK